MDERGGLTGASAAGGDPGPRDDAEAAVNPYDWQGLPRDHGNLGTLGVGVTVCSGQAAGGDFSVF